MKKSFTILLWLALCSLLKTANLPSGFTETRLATGLDPTGLTILPDGRILIGIKSGKILLIKNDSLLTNPLITIPNVDNWNERGLQTIVADPNFTVNHYLYVFYAYKNPLTNISNNRVSRFTVMGDTAQLNSEVVIINFENLGRSGWHNGGGMVFGTDGKLYISTGENAIPTLAQTLTSLLGKIIRINADGSIPTDNPFYNTLSGQYRAIYALGFRNPFKLNIQQGTGRIFANEVGQGTWEEVNEIKAGRNYGWPGIEGKRVNQTAPANYEDPVFVYNHNNGNCSITGGHFYNPNTAQFPAQYTGKYFLSDYCAGWIRYIDPENNFAVSNFATGIDRPLDIDMDTSGNLYYIARGGLGGGSDQDNTSSNEGELWRVTYTGSGSVSITVNPQNRTVATGSSVTFTVGASGTPPLTYQWQRNGVDIEGATSSSYTVASVALSDSAARFRVVVSNATSTQTSTEAVLTVIRNTAPVAQIITPIAGTLYEAGTTIQFSGIGTDPEDDTLAASAFTWRIDFHHDTHTHPALDPVSGIKSGTFYIPDEGEISDTVWYRIYLTVTDALGAKTTVYRDVYPHKVNITLNTSPTGLPLKLDGATVSTPFTFTGVVGVKRHIETEYIIDSEGNILSFDEWSNNISEASQIIVTPKTNTTYTAFFIESNLDTLTVVADAYVTAGINSNTAYGVADSTSLISKLETNANLTRETYLRFDISSYLNITGAKLRLYGYKNNADNDHIKVQVFGLDNDLWNERLITYMNRPVADTVVLAETTINALSTAAQYYEWDLSSYVKNAKANGKDLISFKISNPEVTTSYVIFNSKEAMSNFPELIVTYTGTVTTLDKDVESNSTTAIFPNPAATMVQFSSNDELQRIEIINTQGQTVWMKDGLDSDHINVDLSVLNTGIYQVLFVATNGKMKTKLLAINK